MKLFKRFVGVALLALLMAYSFKAQGQSNASFTANVGNAPTSKNFPIAKFAAKGGKPAVEKFTVGGVEFTTSVAKQERITTDGVVEAFYVYKTKEAVIGNLKLTNRLFNFNGKPQQGFIYQSAKPSKKTGLYSFYIVMENPGAPGHFGKHRIEAGSDE